MIVYLKKKEEENIIEIKRNYINLPIVLIEKKYGIFNI
jgi:hypothetical protein